MRHVIYYKKHLFEAVLRGHKMFHVYTTRLRQRKVHAGDVFIIKEAGPDSEGRSTMATISHIEKGTEFLAVGFIASLLG